MPHKTVFLFGAGVAAVVLLVLYKNRERFDPSNPNNLAYQAAGSIASGASGGAAAGGEDSVGGVLARIREWASGDDARIREMLRGGEEAGMPRIDETPFNVGA